MVTLWTKWHSLVMLGLFMGATSWLWADWRREIGYHDLVAQSGGKLPRGQGLGVTQVEAGMADRQFNFHYLPQSGSGQFAGQTPFEGTMFTAKSPATGMTHHAAQVASVFYGDATSLLPDLAAVDVYEANNWLEAGFLKRSTGGTRVESRAVQNHSWSIPHAPYSGVLYQDYLLRLDHTICRDGYVCVTGMANDGSASVPALPASAYNVLTVGLTNGNHSRGQTLATYGGGRSKPDLVAPLEFTSFASAAVSGCAGLLRNATSDPLAAKSETIRALLLAGATKEEFPNWQQSQTRPLDAVFGAGEVNIKESFQILQSGRLSTAPAAPLTTGGWDFQTLSPNAPQRYFFRIPTGTHGTISAVLVWNRKVTDADPGPGFSAAASMANLSLRLEDAAQNSLRLSDSPVDNIEHIWATQLAPGDYALRVAGDIETPYAIALRLETFRHTTRVLAGFSGPEKKLVFTFEGLVPGRPYQVEMSLDLKTWQRVQSFTPTGKSFVWEYAQPMQKSAFFRLAWQP